jgi:signal transduction histidine kinase
MGLIERLTLITTNRVKLYGAQYNTFAIFGIINYPLALLYELYIDNNSDGIFIRILSSILCLILLLKNRWPERLKKFLPLFWYICITISIPTLSIYLSLENALSLGWLMNINIGMMILILLLDSVSFLIVGLSGITIGLSLFIISGKSIPSLPNDTNLLLFIYMFLCVTILGTIFARNKETFNHFLQKAIVKKRTSELEKALDIKTYFLNNISHEIRTPIQGFTTISEGLVEHWQDFDETKKLELANMVAHNAQRLSTLVTNLLDLSKFSADKMQMDMKEIDLDKIVKNIIDESKGLYINSKNIEIEFKSKLDMPLFADPKRIGQVLRNLFANSIKFSPDNSKIIAILEIENNDCHFSLQDKGMGIPEKELDTIFEAFTQSSRTKSGAGGTGLGLSICKEILDAHNGKIWAVNNSTSGATFHFTLPVNQET